MDNREAYSLLNKTRGNYLQGNSYRGYFPPIKQKQEEIMKLSSRKLVKALSFGFFSAMLTAGVWASNGVAGDQPQPGAEMIEVGALTEWDSLKEVIVGGYDAVWPQVTPVELSLMELSMAEEEIEEMKKIAGKHMKKELPELYAKFKKEVMDLKNTFESLGVKVYLPRDITPADVELLGSSYGIYPFFPRDMFVTHKNKIIFGSIGMPTQQKSQQLYYEIMNQKAQASENVEMISVPSLVNVEYKNGAKKKNHVPLVDGGDVMFFGKKVFVGNARQEIMGSNTRGIQWLQKILGDEYEVIEVPLKERFFHLDLVLSAPRDGLIMVAPEAFIDGVPKYFDTWDRIEVTADQAMHGALNGLPVDSENYVLGYNAKDDMKWLVKEMEAKGIKVHLVWFNEHNKREGSIRCATQQLLRTPKQ